MVGWGVKYNIYSMIVYALQCAGSVEYSFQRLCQLCMCSVWLRTTWLQVFDTLTPLNHGNKKFLVFLAFAKY